MSDVEETIAVPTDRLDRPLHIGARVRVSESYEHYGDWRNTELIVSGLVAEPGGVNVWVKEADYPEGGHTDGFKPGDLELVGATLKPDSPVCVEIATLEWRDCNKDDPFTMIASTPFGNYSVGQGDTGCVAVLDWPSMWDWWPDAAKGEQDTLEAAQAACQADFTRRTLELVNARSVERVRAETVERCAKALESESQNHDMQTRAVLIAAAHTVRSLTEGEG